MLYILEKVLLAIGSQSGGRRAVARVQDEANQFQSQYFSYILSQWSLLLSNNSDMNNGRFSLFTLWICTIVISP